jgi:hypothetical protein
MTRSALRAARPEVLDNSGTLSERIGPDEKVSYFFGGDFETTGISRERLVVIARSIRPPEPSTQLTNAIQNIQQYWTAKLGSPDTIPTRELVRGQKRISLHVRIWSTSRQYLLLSFERDATSPATAQMSAYHVIVQDKRLDPEMSIPDR